MAALRFPQQLGQFDDIAGDPSRLSLPQQFGCLSSIADHTWRRLNKRTRKAIIAHAHASTHATIAMSRLEPKKKDHQAKAQQRNVRSFQPAPPGPGSARARAIGARTIARDPKIIRLSLSTGSISEPLRRKIKADPLHLHIDDAATSPAVWQCWQRCVEPHLC
jgi:hypothetical protein